MPTGRHADRIPCRQVDTPTGRRADRSTRRQVDMQTGRHAVQGRCAAMETVTFAVFSLSHSRPVCVSTCLHGDRSSCRLIGMSTCRPYICHPVAVWPVCVSTCLQVFLHVDLFACRTVCISTGLHTDYRYGDMSAHKLTYLHTKISVLSACRHVCMSTCLRVDLFAFLHVFA